MTKVYYYKLAALNSITEFIEYRVHKNHTFHNSEGLATEVKDKRWEHLFDKTKLRSCNEYMFI